MNQTHFRKRMIYEPLLRLIHLMMALSIIFLLFSGLLLLLNNYGEFRSNIIKWHILFGNLVFQSLCLRCILFLVGDSHSRFFAVFKFKLWILALNNYRRIASLRPWGHDPIASIAYLALFMILAISIFTGYFITSSKFATGLFKDFFFDSTLQNGLELSLHQLSALSILGFILLHLFGLNYRKRKEKLPVFNSMWTGIQYRKKGKKDL